jgi:hypothetical protein
LTWMMNSTKTAPQLRPSFSRMANNVELKHGLRTVSALTLAELQNPDVTLHEVVCSLCGIQACMSRDGSRSHWGVGL